MKQKEFFVTFWAIFCPFALNDPENQNFKEMKNIPGEIIFLHMCTINEDHMIYENFLSFWEIFCSFNPPPPPPPPPDNLENRSFEKLKKNLEILSFYTCVPEMTIISCMVPEICSARFTSSKRINIIRETFILHALFSISLLGKGF